MLSLAKAAKDYYLQKLGERSPREDYYLRGGTATGRWVGSGAAYLDLHGSVSAEGLLRLFDGEHPATGERLGRRLRKDGVSAWDVTFSADKSVSLLWALGDEHTRKEVVEAFEEATSQALGYLESVASATRGASKTVVTDDQGNRKCRVRTWSIPTSGYVAAAFTEYTSRADDPQLHTRVVVANKVQGADGVWRSLDGRLLYRYQLAAGYLHEAVLRKELTERLGVRWQPVRNGMADIEGFTRAQIEAFSRRREELEAWREAQGLADTPAARQVAVIATRTRKYDHPIEELEVEWRQRAIEVGLTPGFIAGILDRGREVSLPDPGRLAERLTAPEGLTAKTATFGRAEVVRELAGALPEGGTREEVEALADRFLQQQDMVVKLPGRDASDVPGHAAQVVDEPTAPVASIPDRDNRSLGIGGELRYTTSELLGVEQRIIQRALNSDGRRWRAPDRVVEAVLARHPDLNEGQREMVRRFATSGHSIDVGVGPAGSGKTTVMALLARLATLTGTPILGTALAARTATGLQSATGIPSSSLTALTHQIQEHGLPRGVVVVVDEASMVDTRQLAALSDHVEEPGGKLILIGDPHQLPELEAGGLFHALSRRLPGVELTENIRQHQPWEREALTRLRNGSVDQAVNQYRQHQRLHVGPNREDTIRGATRDWYQHVTNTGDLRSGILIGYDNQTVNELNQHARALLVASGHLHGPTLDVGDNLFQTGDRILCRKNQHRLDLLNGDLGTVTEVDPERKRITVRLDRDPEVRELPAWYLTAGLVDYGYALTGHKAQGITCDRTFIVVNGTTTREWAYVALSRGREANTIYLTTPDQEEQCTHLTHADPRVALDDVSRLLSRNRLQTAAVDHQAPERTTRGYGADTVEIPPGDGEEMERTLRSIAYYRALKRQHERRIGRGIGR